MCMKIKKIYTWIEDATLYIHAHAKFEVEQNYVQGEIKKINWHTNRCGSRV
jgi:hypothetical protein